MTSVRLALRLCVDLVRADALHRDLLALRQPRQPTQITIMLTAPDQNAMNRAAVGAERRLNRDNAFEYCLFAHHPILQRRGL